MKTPFQRFSDDLHKAVQAFAASLDAGSDDFANWQPLLTATEPLPLVSLSQWERMLRDAVAAAQWPPAGPWSADQRARFDFRATWIDLSCGNGHVRERALHDLNGPAPNRFFFALAARRINDWVPQVRQAARPAILRLAARSDAGLVTDALWSLLSRWADWGRAQDVDKKIVDEVLALDGVTEALVHKMLKTPSGPVPSILTQALRTAALDPYLERLATTAVEPRVRAVAQRTLLMGKAVWLEGRQWRWTDVRYCEGRMHRIEGERTLSQRPDTLAWMDVALADRSPVVRWMASDALIRQIEHLGPAALPIARRLAADASGPIAERGAFIVNRLAPPPGQAEL